MTPLHMSGRVMLLAEPDDDQWPLVALGVMAVCGSPASVAQQPAGGARATD
jgi:hypothetical protein